MTMDPSALHVYEHGEDDDGFAVQSLPLWHMGRGRLLVHVVDDAQLEELLRRLSNPAGPARVGTADRLQEWWVRSEGTLISTPSHYPGWASIMVVTVDPPA